MNHITRKPNDILFVSSDMRIESFKVFVEHINKLRRKGHNEVGRVIFEDGLMIRWTVFQIG